MGALVVAAGALFTMIRASTQQRTQTLLETELRHFAGAVRAAPYVACAPLAESPYGGAFSPAASIKAEIAGMAYWNQPSPGSADFSDNTFVATPADLRQATAGEATTFATRADCDPNRIVYDDGVQRVTIRVTDTASNQTLATTVVKRATACTGTGGTVCR